MSPVLDPERDYYAVLGVSPEANREEIRAAHRRMARRYHPDTGQGDPKAFRLTQEAYEVLSKPALRRAYDLQRHSRGLTPDAPIVVNVVLSRKEMPALDTTQRLYVMLDIQGTGPSGAGGQPLNLALVLDCSTSMQGRRIKNVKLATHELIDSLSNQDRLAIVKFSDRPKVIASSATVDDKVKLQSAVTRLRAEGGTEIFQGVLAGLREVRRHASPKYLNHVILLTDGHTYGDEELALTEARQAISEGIGISAVGIGSDWNDLFLDRLARAGQGICDYVRSATHLKTILHNQVKDLSAVSLRDAHLYVNHAAYVDMRSAARIVPYMEELEVYNNSVITLANLGDETNTLLLELLIHQPNIGEYRLARTVFEATSVASSDIVRVQRDIVVDFVKKKIQQLDEAVPMRMLSMLSRLVVFRMQEQAWRVLESGDQQRATQLLESAATRLFDMGHRELARAAMLEAKRVSQGAEASQQGRKDVRFGTRGLSIHPDK